MRSYLVVTAGYWAFTLTDGAIRMLVVLYFYGLGYSPLEVAALFLFYEFFGIVTNLVGGWLGARVGLNLTMQAGMALQVVALAMLFARDLHLTPTGALLAALSGAVTSGLGYVIWYAALRSLATPTAAIAQLAVPVIAALGGVVFVAESLTLRLVGASAPVLGGIALTVRDGTRGSRSERS